MKIRFHLPGLRYNFPLNMILVGMMVWVLFFYACCTYRFLGIFIQLIVGSGVAEDSAMVISVTQLL